MLTSHQHLRRGAVAPVVAMILPALFILASMAINIAYMQLVSTEMKIAVDACAHAGGTRDEHCTIDRCRNNRSS